MDEEQLSSEERRIKPILEANAQRYHNMMRRVDALVQIVSEEEISTQPELMDRLNERFPEYGCSTRITLTQAMKRAGIVKGLDGYYIRPIWSPKEVKWGLADSAFPGERPLRDELTQEQLEEVLRTRIATDVLNVDLLGNMAVLNCSKNLGVAVHDVLINLNWPEMWHVNPSPHGALVICKSEEDAKKLKERLLVLGSSG